jgi:hypothetical protein
MIHSEASNFSLIGAMGAAGSRGTSSSMPSSRRIAQSDDRAMNQLSIVMNVPPAPSRHERAVPQTPAGTYRGASTPSTISCSTISPALPKVHRRRMLVHNNERDRHSAQHNEAAQSARHLPPVPSLMFPSSRPSTSSSAPAAVTMSSLSAAAAVKGAHRVAIFDGDLAYVRRNIDQYAAVVDNASNTRGGDAQEPPPLAKPVRDLVLWEHLRKLRSATAADRFDGSTAVLEETLAAFEIFLRHGLGCSESAISDASIVSVYSENQRNPTITTHSTEATNEGGAGEIFVEKDLAILLYHVCKAGLLHDSSAVLRQSPKGQVSTTITPYGEPDDEGLLPFESSAARGGVGGGGDTLTRRRSSVAAMATDPSIEVEFCSSNVIQVSSPTIAQQQQYLPQWTLGGQVQQIPDAAHASGANAAAITAVEDDATLTSVALEHTTTASIFRNTQPSTFYDTIRGRDLAQRHPTVQTFKRSLIRALDEAQSMRATVEVLHQRLQVAQTTIENYQRAYHAITSGGIPMKKILKNGAGVFSGSVRSGRPSTSLAGTTNFADESVMSRGRSPIEDSTMTAGLRDLSPHSQSVQSLNLGGGGGLSQDLMMVLGAGGGYNGAASHNQPVDVFARQTSAASYSQPSAKRRPSASAQHHQQGTTHQPQHHNIAATATSASSSVSAPTPLAVPTGHGDASSASRHLKPVALGAAEKLIDELLAQNGTLIQRVTDLAAEKATYTSRIVYLERQVEQLNQAVTSLSASNFDLAHQYKSSLYRNSSSGNASQAPGTASGTSAGFMLRDITSGGNSAGGDDPPLFSPMLLDGRSAEMVAHQSTLEIMKLLGLPFPATTSPGGAVGSASAPSLLLAGGGVVKPPHPPPPASVFTVSAHPPSHPQHQHLLLGGDAADVAAHQQPSSSLNPPTTHVRRKSATFTIETQ